MPDVEADSPPPATRAVPELSTAARELAMRFFHPMELLFRPTLTGLENLPTERPVMFIGNHQFLSFDTPFLIAELWRQGIFVRALGDNFLFVLPGVAQWFGWYGVLPASPEVARALLRRGESILVYPGGAREASKNAGHTDLDWLGRLGFAHLALQERCTIVPVAAVGVDDRIRLLVAPKRYLDSPLGRLVDAMHLRRDMFLPFFLPRGVPRPAFHICPAISVDRYLGRDPIESAHRLRADTAEAIEQGIEILHHAPTSGH